MIPEFDALACSPADGEALRRRCSMLEASMRADRDARGGRIRLAPRQWHRILNAIERLQAKTPAEGEKVH